jgi:hypothetical protein
MLPIFFLLLAATILTAAKLFSSVVRSCGLLKQQSMGSEKVYRFC